MKNFLLMTIIGFVLAALAAIGVPQPLASPTAAECDCSHLEALQVELRNALLLQQAMRNKIPELRALDQTKSLTEYKRFSENDARRGLKPAPGYEKLSKADQAALSQYNFDVKGFALSDPTHPPKTEEWNEATLCSLTASAQLALTKVRSLAVCTGISAAIQAHEDVHTHTCLRGFVAFFGMNGAERAQDEVEAYGAQIAVLRAEIAKVLEHTVVRIESEAHTRFTMPPSPAPLTAEVVDNRADVPMSRVSVSGEMIKLEGQGNQTTNATLEGNCRFTGGMPFTLPARVTMETDGLDVQIRYTVEGKAPTLKSECTIEGQTATGTLMPHDGGGNALVINLPLENGAEKVFDHSTGDGAKIVAQAGVKMTGQSKIRLILCEQSK